MFPDESDIVTFSQAIDNVSQLLLTCRKIYHEARPLLLSRLHLNVRGTAISGADPGVSRLLTCGLSRYVKSLTLDGADIDARYGFEFNLKCLPSLECVYIMENANTFAEYVYRSGSIEKLAAVPFGRFDESYVSDWFD